MRYALLPSVLLALAMVGCGDNNDNQAKPPVQPSNTAPTSRTAPADAPVNTAGDAKAQEVPADNTGRNVRDDGSTLTPLDQGTSEQDIAITRAVREAVVAHKGLSTNAQNVKIITKDGVVTLRGPVASDSERDAIVAVAQGVPQVTTVVNKLEVASR
jgi:hyperosmotically inducible periplasmic protein